MKEFQAVCLAAILLCIGFGGGWYAHSQKAETPRFYTSADGDMMYRYDPATDRFVTYNWDKGYLVPPPR